MSFKFTSAPGQPLRTLEPMLLRILDEYRHEALFDKQDFFERFAVAKALAALTDVEGIMFSDLQVKGFLSSGWSLAECRDVLERYWHSVGQDGRIGVTVGFEERESKQSADAYDMISVSLEKGSPYVSYFSNASKVSMDPAYAKTFFGEVISNLSLPMVLVEADGFYSLEANDGNDLRTSGGLLGRNPTSFTCESPQLNSSERLAGVLGQFCERFAGDGIFEVYWSASHSGLKDGVSPGHALVVSLYNATVATLDADNHEIDAAYSLQGLRGLDAVASLCGETDEVVTPFWNLFPDETRVCISLVTASAGHGMQLVSESQAALDAIRKSIQL